MTPKPTVPPHVLAALAALSERDRQSIFLIILNAAARPPRPRRKKMVGK